jgi:hypothetical protein
MKHLVTFLIATALLPAAAHAQAAPDYSAPDNSVSAPPPDPMWSWVERLVNGQPIVVKPTAGPSVHCRFAGATDAYLFCDPDNARYAASGYRFDRAQVDSVKISHPKVNWHPEVLTIAAGIGIVTGCAASSQGASDKTAAAGGLATALIAAAIGYPIAIMQEDDRGFAFTLPLPVLRFSGPRVRGIVHWSPR